MKKDSFGDRMKNNYESRARTYLTRRTPVILRLDGKAFHTLTRGFKKPFSEILNDSMVAATQYLFENIQGATLAYTQSDEISILLKDYNKLTSDAWFDYNIQKMCSVAASMASVTFTKVLNKKEGFFDCRAFNLPKEEVTNYFLWRQMDWIRNSVQMLSQSVYSQKQLHKKNISEMHEMLYQKKIIWTELSPKWKNGVFIYKAVNTLKTVIDESINLKTVSDKDFINMLVHYTEES